MRIFGLYGHANCGKSATLNMLKELLRVAGKSISFTPHPDSDKPETFDYNGQIVCVAPGGDTREVVEANCQPLAHELCFVLIIQQPDLLTFRLTPSGSTDFAYPAF